jgi:beta-galactosidase/beta-glucuronidase
LLITIQQIKVENELFYQACDELGILVIQDMPSLRPSQSKTLANCTVEPILPDPAQQKEFTRQLELLINQHKSFPSIATWVWTVSVLMLASANPLH